MKTLYLIRHAQSQANAGGAPLPDHLLPLTAQGEQQAQRLAHAWPHPPAALYCSQLLRTQQTAQPLCARHRMTALPLPELNELSYLSFQRIQSLDTDTRRTLAQQYWQTATPDYRDAPECDSFTEFSQRVERFCQRLTAFPANSLFFTHGIWIARLIWKTQGLHVTCNADMQRFRQFTTALAIPNTAVFTLTVHDGRPLHVQQLETGR